MEAARLHWLALGCLTLLVILPGVQSMFQAVVHPFRRINVSVFGSSTDTNEVPPMVVVFGRPGAGKSTVADAAIDVLSKIMPDMKCIGLDLDVCVPQRMRDNFAMGIYPTWQERQEFALEACNYVESKLIEERVSLLEKSNDRVLLSSIVSFSFVNTDLRDAFRARFPLAAWALIDTSEAEATMRINERQGHFYKGAPYQDEHDIQSESRTSTQVESIADNSEWNFAPVTFPHMLLPGDDSVEENARRVAVALQKACNVIT